MFYAAAANRRVTLTAEGLGFCGGHAHCRPRENQSTAIKVNRTVPHRNKTNGDASPSRKSFRRRYDELEQRRSELIARVTSLGAAARAHPAYKRSLTLLNDSFRKGRLAQRLAVLEAAAWLIDVLEKLTSLT